MEVSDRHLDRVRLSREVPDGLAIGERGAGGERGGLLSGLVGVAFLGAVLIAALGVLTFLGREYRQGESAATFVVIAASLCLAGAGQFVGALRNGQTFAAAFGCSAVSLLLVSAPLFGSDWGVELVREGLTERLPFAVLVSLLPALASVGIAIFLPVPARPMESARPATDGRTSPADQGDRPSSTAFRDKTSGLRE